MDARIQRDRARRGAALYVGVDCQIGTWYPELIDAFIGATRPDLLPAAAAALDPLRIPRGAARDRYRSMTPVEFHDIEADLAALLELFDTEAASLSAASATEFRLHRQLVLNLAAVHATSYDGLQDRRLDAARLREQCMADNARWAPTLAGEPVKTVLWAHNWHIAYDEVEPASGEYSMGGHLRNVLGADYRTVGFSFTRGTLTAVGADGITAYAHDDAPPPGSVNELLHAARAPDYILDIAALPADSRLRTWLSDWRPVLSVGSVYQPPGTNYYTSQMRLARAFDVLIHVDRTTHSVLIR